MAMFFTHSYAISKQIKARISRLELNERSFQQLSNGLKSVAYFLSRVVYDNASNRAE